MAPKITVLAAIVSMLACTAGADDWAQWRGANRDGIWREKGLLKAFDTKQVKVLWRAKIAAGYSGPTVADARVYVTDRHDKGPTTERVHCFNAKTGKTIWTRSYPCRYRIGYALGPRASVTVDDGLAHVLGAMGHFHCLDAATGKIIWKLDAVKAYRARNIMWGFAATPLVYGDLVILHIGGTGGACIVALDKKTGREKWKAVDDGMSYSAPIVITRAKNDVLICWTKRFLVGLSPRTGRVYWQVPFGITKSWQMSSITPLVEGNFVFVSACYDGSMLVRMSPDGRKARKVWQKRGVAYNKTVALQCVHSTPVIFGGHIYGIDGRGQFRCIETETGKRLWEDLTLTPRGQKWGTVHMVQNGETTWMFNESGEVIIGKLSPDGFRQISRAKLIEPTDRLPGRLVCWSHPAFANKCIYARNDRELVCGDLSAE